MSRDDIIYLLLLLTSIPLGHLVKCIKNAHGRQFVTFSAGLFLVLLTAGLEGGWHSAVTILGNYFLFRLVGVRWCHIASFIYVFGYLFFFRTCTWYGLRQPPSHCNAIQLLVTLRMVGMAFEIRNSVINPVDDEDDKTARSKQTNPSLYDFYSYGYCYCGLMTGPYYSYKTYRDMLCQDTSKIATFIPAVKSLRYLPLFSIPYLILHYNFPLKHVESVEYLQHRWGVIYRLLYLVPCFTWFRFRFYIGWMLAESMCVTMALGAYPFESEPKPGIGPTKKVILTENAAAIEHDPSYTHSFKTIDNIDIFDVEFTSSCKGAMIAWNKTVQWWLYTYVHRQIPFPFKSFRMTIVLFVSAFWHGVHPGYYVTFMSVPLLALADTRMKNAIKPHLNENQSYIYDWLTWFCLYRSYEYLGVGFMMLRLDIIWNVYKSVYFIGHIVLILFVLIPCFIPKSKVRHTDEGKHQS